MTDEKPPASTGRPCPICGKPSTPEHRPFCSRRCADVDLSRWFSGLYRVPAEESGAPDDEAPEPS